MTKELPRRINAIDPNTGELVLAAIFPNHFGPGKDAIRTDSRSNTPYYAADDIEWEEISDV